MLSHVAEQGVPTLQRRDQELLLVALGKAWQCLLQMGLSVTWPGKRASRSHFLVQIGSVPLPFCIIVSVRSDAEIVSTSPTLHPQPLSNMGCDWLSMPLGKRFSLWSHATSSWRNALFHGFFSFVPRKSNIFNKNWSFQPKVNLKSTLANKNL